MAPKAAVMAGAGVATALEEMQPFGDVQRLNTVDAILAATTGCQSPPLTSFQSNGWLSAVYTKLVPASTARPLGLSVSSGAAGSLVFPLYTQRVGAAIVARFADCGVTDYNAPLGQCALGPQLLIAKMKPALRGVDVLALERMPEHAANPLTRHPWATSARLEAHVVQVPDGVDAFVSSRGKKFRKEVERCYRVLSRHGAWTFARAQTAAQIELAFASLECQQGERHAGKAAAYALAAPQYAAFYRAVLADPSGFAAIFTLSVNDEIIAVLLGIVHQSTFTLLRIANGGDAWKQLSPGRLVVVEAMRYYQDKGVTQFDMGMGDYAFKRGFGANTASLFDLVLPLTVRGLPYAGAFHLKARLRQNDRLRGLVQRLRGKGHA